MASVKITHNFTGETGYVIIVPKKTTAPLTDVVCIIDGVAAQTRKVYPAPHGQESLVVDGLDPVMYFFTAFRSADGSALDEQINILAADAGTGAIHGIKKIDYVVDGAGANDPASGQSSLRDPQLLNGIYWVEERATGPMKDNEIIDRSDDGGGFDWADAGKQFLGGEYFVFLVEAQTGSAPVVTGGGYDGVFVLDHDQTFNPATMSNKYLISRYSGNVGTLVLPALSGLIDCNFKLLTHDATTRNVVLQFGGGDNAKFLGIDRNKIILGRGEELEIFVKDNEIFVVTYNGDHRRLNERFFADALHGSGSIADNTGNSLYCDGSNLLQATYPRCLQIMNELPSGQVVSYPDWNTGVTLGGVEYFGNRGKWARDDGAGTFKVPLVMNSFFKAITHVAGVPTTDLFRQAQGVGAFGKDWVGPHFHPVGTEPSGNAEFQRVITNITNRYWTTGNDNPNDRHGSTDFNNGTGSHTETTPKHVDLFALIII